MLRADLDTAIGNTPPHVRDQIYGASARCLELVNAHLADNERILQISSAAPRWMGDVVVNSLLVLTDRRLLFVAPKPQVIGWPLVELTKVQALSGRSGSVAGFHVECGEASFQLGADGGWNKAFEDHVNVAIAMAVLANN